VSFYGVRFAFLFIFPVIAFAKTVPFKDNLLGASARLSKSEKREYNGDLPYAKVANDPENFTNKKECKRKFTILYKGYLPELPQPYDALVSKSFYLMQIEGDEKRLPIIFSPRKGLEERIKELPLDSFITVYGDVRQKTLRGAALKSKKKITQKTFYFFFLDDVEEFKGGGSEDFSKFDASRFLSVKFMRLDIQGLKFINKEIKFDMRFKSISNKIDPAIIKYGGIEPDSHFVFVPVESFSIPIIVNRNNENCVGPIVNAKPNGKLNLCGILRSASNPLEAPGENKKGYLYIYLMGINEIIE
jgi:hypothetical protein